MPQSSDEMRDLMQVLFKELGPPDYTGIDDGPPTHFLQKRGYTLTDKWEWKKPNPEHWISIKEELAIRFLQEEWDFGDVIE